MSLQFNHDLWPPPRSRPLIYAGPSLETWVERLKLVEAGTLMVVSIYSNWWSLYGPWPTDTATAVRSQRWGCRRGSLLLQGPGAWLVGGSGEVRMQEIWGTQPSVWPRAPSSPAALRLKDLEGPGRRLWSIPHALCLEDPCKLTIGRAGPRNLHSGSGAKGLAITLTSKQAHWWAYAEDLRLTAVRSPNPITILVKVFANLQSFP